MANQQIAVVSPTPSGEKMAVGMGGLEGAERLDRETVLWRPALGSPDMIINRAKDSADARGQDMMMNDGHTIGAINVHKDSIVGALYALNAQPNLRVLSSTGKKFDETWATEMQEVVEARFRLIAESEACWLDASRSMTLTAMIRLAVGAFVYTGEVLATGEWFNRDPQRPLATAVQLTSPRRLCNPDNQADTRFLRRGVAMNKYRRPLGYWFRTAHPGEAYDSSAYEWRYVPAEKPWGRKQVIHIVERMMIDQTRGIAEMVTVLKRMRMTKQFSEIALQHAVVQASYAAAIESELPPEAVAAMMGGNTGADNYQTAIATYLTALTQYIGGSQNLVIDGVKIPHLFPGTKLSMQALGAPGGVGENFEQSMQRHIAAGLGLSHEEFSRDFKNVSYSGLRGIFNFTSKFMTARKKTVADRLATNIYQLVFEEEMSNGEIPLPVGVRRDFFYKPLMKEALTQCTWLGAGSGQIDELKETQAAILRIKAGLSTYEIEIAKMGGRDWREIFAQAAREQNMIAGSNGGTPLAFDLSASKASSSDQSQQQQSDNTDGSAPAGGDG